MSHHSKYSAVFPLHVRKRGLIQLHIEPSEQMCEREVELAVCKTGNISPAPEKS